MLLSSLLQRRRQHVAFAQVCAYVYCRESVYVKALPIPFYVTYTIMPFDIYLLYKQVYLCMYVHNINT